MSLSRGRALKVIEGRRNDGSKICNLLACLVRIALLLTSVTHSAAPHFNAICDP